MANSFFQSVAPDIAAAVVKIDANKTVIDENKVILVDVHDTDLPAVKTDIGTNLTAIGANNTILSDVHDTDLPDAVTKIDDVKTVVDAIQPDQFFSVLPGDTILLSADIERSTILDVYTKVKEILISFTGYYRLSFELKNSEETFWAYGRVYKGDVAFGDEQNNKSLTYIEYSQDMWLTYNDLIQLYVKHQNAGSTSFIKNFRIKGTVSAAKGSVITD